MKKILFLILIIVVLATAGIVIAWQQRKVVDDAVTAAPATAGELAAKTIKFIDAALDPATERYDLSYTCSEVQKTCKPRHNPDIPPHMGYAIISLREVGLATGDTRLVEKSKTILHDAINKCADDPRYCEWNFFPLHHYYKATGDQKYLDAMLAVSGNVTAPRPVRDLIKANIPVKWWRLYDATGDEKYLKQLTDLADEQLRVFPAERLNDDLVYRDGQTDVRSYDLPMIWAVYMPAWFASRDEKYLAPAREFFDATDLAANTSLFFDVTATGNLLKGVESLLNAAEAIPERREAYRKEALDILRVVLQERLDTPDRTLVNGDHGLLVSPHEKETNIQGWLTYTLLELGDEPLKLEGLW